MSKVTMNFNKQLQPLRINNSIGQTVIITVDPITNEFIITSEGQPSIVIKDAVSCINM